MGWVCAAAIDILGAMNTPGGIALVVTSIASDSHPILRELSRGCAGAGWRFVVIGDTKSPATFSLEGCEFLSVDDQLAWGQKLNLRYARSCPTRHYARKNVGYLEAIRGGAGVIVETDDDNVPLGNGERGTASGERYFYGVRDAAKRVRVVTSAPVTDAKGNVSQAWVNVYRYFTKHGDQRGEPAIWPRGLALDWIHKGVPELAGAAVRDVTCPIQQGLANDNPDVDAVYRLCRSLPFSFEDGESVGLGDGAWCPFNSQNTTWFPAAFPMLYLPALCSFRMTDIWRSFVAQRVCWANGWPILFHRATVRQERNDHNLMRDFEDEISGYLQNAKIAETLAALDLPAGEQHVAANVRRCYHAMTAKGLLPLEEVSLLDAWLHDLSMVRNGPGNSGSRVDAGTVAEVKPHAQVKA